MSIRDLFYPTPSLKKQLVYDDPAPMTALFSGEITGNIGGPIGTCNIPGKIKDVYFSLEERGRDDSNDLYLEVDVFINGTTCLTTKPKSVSANGVASTAITTCASGEGVTEAVIDTTANTVAKGDMLRYWATPTRTASPTTEMSDGALIVIIEPF